MQKKISAKFMTLFLSVLMVFTSLPIVVSAADYKNSVAVSSWMTGYSNLASGQVDYNGDTAHNVYYNGANNFSINAWVLPVPSFDANSKRITSASVDFTIHRMDAAASDFKIDFYMVSVSKLNSHLSSSFNFINGNYSTGETVGYFTRQVSWSDAREALGLVDSAYIGSFSRSASAVSSATKFSVDSALLADMLSSQTESGYFAIVAAANSSFSTSAATFFGRYLSVSYSVGDASDIVWRNIASTDFTKGAAFVSDGYGGSIAQAIGVSGSTGYIGSGFSPLKDTKTVKWNVVNYGQTNVPEVNDGIRIPNGFAYINDYDGGTPITGLESFKIAYEFDTTATSHDFGVERPAFALIKLWSGGAVPSKDYSSGFVGEAGNRNVLTQYCNLGKVYAGTTSIGTNPSNFWFRVNGYNRYELEYNGKSHHLVGTMYTPTSSVVVVDTDITIDTNRITSISLGDPDAEFMMNMKIKSIAFYGDVDEVSDVDKPAILRSAMDKYEAKMSGGRVYTNMAPAYTAYVNCQKAYDAIVYGKNNSINAASYSKALNNAVLNMRDWSAPHGSFVPGFCEEDACNSNNATNCLWAETNNDPYVSQFTNYNTVQLFYYHQSVYMYDGNIRIPFMLGFYRYSGLPTANPRNPRVWYCNLTAQNGGLFVAESTYRGGGLDTRDFRTVYSAGYRISSSQSLSDSIILSTGDMRYMANYFTINSIPNGTYYVQAYPTTFRVGYGNRDDTSYCETHDLTLSTDRRIYVINYKALLDRINSTQYASYFRNISSYKEGGLLALMQAFDTATAVDPTSYEYSQSTLSKVQSCANTIKSAVDKFNSVGTPTADSSDYALLRAKLEHAEYFGFNNPQITDGSTSTSRYTVASWNNYLSAYNLALSAISNVITADGYAANYSGSGIANIANGVSSSISSLKYNYIVRFINCNNECVAVMTTSDGGRSTDFSVPNSPPVSLGDGYHAVYTWQNKTFASSEYGSTEIINVNENEETDMCLMDLDCIVSPATCTSPEVKRYHCEICNSVQEFGGRTLPHDYSVEIIEPTCTQQGYSRYTCISCGHQYTDNYVDSIPHTYVTTVIDPTCVDRGYTADICSVCGDEVIDEDTYVDALGHIYSYKIVEYPCCTFCGAGEYYCPRCHDAYTEILPVDADTHRDFAFARTVAPTQTEQGYDIWYCADLCGYWEKRNITPSLSQSAEFADYLATYNSAVEMIITNFAPYTADSVDLYTSAVSTARALGEQAIADASVSDIESATRTIIEASSLLRIRTCSVIVYVNLSDDSVRRLDYTDGVDYGDTLSIDVSRQLGGKSINKWTIEQNGVTRRIDLSDPELDVVITDDAVINAYPADNDDSRGLCKVTMLNKNDRVIGTAYVPIGYIIDVSDHDILGVSAPDVPFYTFAKWDIVSGSSTVDGDTVLRASYQI